jgi:hypothetical protein
MMLDGLYERTEMPIPPVSNTDLWRLISDLGEEIFQLQRDLELSHAEHHGTEKYTKMLSMHAWGVMCLGALLNEYDERGSRRV